MYTNSAVALVAFSALAEQALAFNSHRHLHNNLEKRVQVTDWVTLTETIYYTPGEEAAAEPTTHHEFVSNKKPSEVVPVEVKPTTSIQPTTSSIPSSSSIPPSSSSVIPTSAQIAIQAAPQPTTLVTQAKPAPAPSSSSDGGLLGGLLSSLLPAAPAPSTAPSSGGSPFSAKRGLAYNDPTLANAFGTTCGKSCAWGYNWGQSNDGLQDKYNFVPMLWNDSPERVSSWDSNVQSAIAKGSKAILGFNEPDNAGQANMSPAAAAAAHAKYMNKYAGQVLVGAPAITNSGNFGEGVQWLTAFMSACKAQGTACQVDFCPVHWYSPAEYADTLFTHLEAAHKACGDKPIWLTEFAPSGSPEQINDFLTTNIPKLEQLDYLHAYSYFMVSANSLMQSQSLLSSFGKIYASILS